MPRPVNLSLSSEERNRLIPNMADDLRKVKSPAVRAKMVSFFYRANQEYGTRLAEAVKVPLPAVKSAIAD